MGDPTKRIKLVFETDEANKRAIENEFKKLGSIKVLSDEEKKSLESFKLAKQQLQELNNLLSEYEGINTDAAKEMAEGIRDQIKKYEDELGITAAREEEAKEEEKAAQEEERKKIKEQIVDLVVNQLKSLGNSFLRKLGGLFTDAWKELESMIGYSRLSNEETRNLAFTYGFSASESYGYSQAMSALGFKSEEDLMYATGHEIQLFKDAFTKYSEKYEKLYDEGTFKEMLEYQVEMNEFKQDMKLEIVDFFMQNKDTIKAGMKAIMTIADITMKIASFLLGTDRAASRSAAVSDTISNYTNKSVTNVTVDNTFNGIDTSQRQNLLQLGTLTTQQLIAALK